MAGVSVSLDKDVVRFITQGQEDTIYYLALSRWFKAWRSYYVRFKGDSGTANLVKLRVAELGGLVVEESFTANGVELQLAVGETHRHLRFNSPTSAVGVSCCNAELLNRDAKGSFSCLRQKPH